MSKCDKVKLSELIIQKTDTEQIVDMENEHYITLSLYGKGARERVIKDGKYPVPFTGYRVSSGQFIYSRIDARNGAYAIIGPELDGFVVSKDFPVFDINESKVLPHFLRRAVLSAAFINQVKNSSFGATNRMRIKEEVFETYSIPLPELSKQNEIVDIMDRVETIINSLQQELQKLDDLIKARFIELFGDLNVNPKGWELKPFDELTNLITDGEHSTPRRCKEGIYLLSARNVLNHELQLEDVDYIDDEEYERISKRIIPQSGDVLLSCSGTVGRCCCVPEGLKFQMVRSIALLRFKEELNPVFAEYMITSDFVQQQIDKAKTASSQANLFQGKIAKLRGFVPPRELQDEFLVFVKQVDKSKAAVQKSLDETQVLFDSLMQKYFG